jgi:hypothetical protein
MKTNPIDNFIPRDLEPQVQKLLTRYSEFLEEIVNYGSHIMTWKPNDFFKGDEALPISLFFRNYLSYVDACSILVKYSSIEPCNGLLRTAFENLLYILYLIDDPSGKKAKGYIIWNAFEKKKLLSKCDGTSQAYLKLAEKFKDNELLKDEKPPILKDIERLKEKNHNLLTSPQYVEIVKEYHRTTNKIKSKSTYWYSLFNGPNNIRQLATKLDLEPFYEILYKSWSSSTHGTSVIDGIVTGDENGIAQIYQLRLPFDVESVTGLCTNLSVLLFSKYIKARFPEKERDFQKWYSSFSQETKILLQRILFLKK